VRDGNAEGQVERIEWRGKRPAQRVVSRLGVLRPVAGRDAPESRSHVAFRRRVGKPVHPPTMHERVLTLDRLDDVRQVREIDVEPTGTTDSYSPSRQRSRRNLDASPEALRGTSLPL